MGRASLDETRGKRSIGMVVRTWRGGIKKTHYGIVDHRKGWTLAICLPHPSQKTGAKDFPKQKTTVQDSHTHPDLSVCFTGAAHRKKRWSRQGRPELV